MGILEERDTVLLWPARHCSLIGDANGVDSREDMIFWARSVRLPMLRSGEVIVVFSLRAGELRYMRDRSLSIIEPDIGIFVIFNGDTGTFTGDGVLGGDSILFGGVVTGFCSGDGVIGPSVA